MPTITRKNGLRCETWGDGHLEWYSDVSGYRHRIDGPAVIFNDGSMMWWLNDTCYSLDAYMDALHMSSEDMVLFKLKWGGRHVLWK